MNVLTAMSLFNLGQLGFLPVDTDRLRSATKSDPTLSQIVTYVKTGWPDLVDTEFKPYANRRNELTMEADCLLWGVRVIIPE